MIQAIQFQAAQIASLVGCPRANFVTRRARPNPRSLRRSPQEKTSPPPGQPSACIGSLCRIEGPGFGERSRCPFSLFPALPWRPKTLRPIERNGVGFPARRGRFGGGAYRGLEAEVPITPVFGTIGSTGPPRGRLWSARRAEARSRTPRRTRRSSASPETGGDGTDGSSGRKWTGELTEDGGRRCLSPARGSRRAKLRPVSIRSLSGDVERRRRPWPDTDPPRRRVPRPRRARMGRALKTRAAPTARPGG